MEAGEHGLTRGTCIVTCRLVVVAVAGLLLISWCVLGAPGFLIFVFFACVFVRTHTACCNYEAAMPHFRLY